MKICLLNDDYPPHAHGGAAVVVASLARVLANRGHSVHVITTVADTRFVGTVSENGVRISRVYSDYHERWQAWRSLYNPGSVNEVRRILRDTRPDVVHAHNVHQHLSYGVFKVTKEYAGHLILTAHDAMSFNYGKLIPRNDADPPRCRDGWDWRASAWVQARSERFRYNPLRNAFIRRALRSVDTLVCVSHALAAAMAQNGIRADAVVHNGVDTAAWAGCSIKDVMACKRQFDVEGKHVMLFSGRVSELKGARALLSAFAEVAATDQDAVLLFAGAKAAAFESVRSHAVHLGLAHRVSITGWLSMDRLRTLYHAADIVAAPSLYLDPLPTVVLEAMAAGKPVVGSCLGGISELVVHGKTGYLVHPRDTHTFAAYLTDLLQDETKRRAFGNAARRRAREQFSLESFGRRMLALYNASPSSR